MKRTFDVTMVQANGPKLTTRITTLEKAEMVIELFGQPFSVPTQIEVRSDKHMLVYFMVAGPLVQLTLWHQGQSCALASSAFAPDADYIDMSWNSFPSWMVTRDLPQALRAIEKFLSEGSLDSALQWHCQEFKE